MKPLAELTEDQQALVLRHRPLAFLIARDLSKHLQEADKEIILSVAHLALCLAVQKFDPAKISEHTHKPVKFSVYLRQAIHRAARSTKLEGLIHVPHFLDNKKYAQHAYQESATLARAIKLKDPDIMSLIGKVAESQADRLIYQEALDTLSPKRREVVDMHVSGMTFTEIGDRLGISRPSAAKRWDRAIRQLAEQESFSN